MDRSKKFTKDLPEMFQNHDQHKRIIFDDIFFINGKDENDPEKKSIDLSLRRSVTPEKKKIYKSQKSNKSYL
jgi:hypothetical protein